MVADAAELVDTGRVALPEDDGDVGLDGVETYTEMLREICSVIVRDQREHFCLALR